MTHQRKWQTYVYVSQMPANVLLSPSKGNKQQTEYFNFCLTTTTKRYRCVSFSKQHLKLLSSLNDKKDSGLSITNYMKDGNDIKVNSSSLLKIVPLSVECHPQSAEQTPLLHILELDVDTDVSVTCKVIKHSTHEAQNCIIHTYHLADATGTINLTAFKKLSLDVDKSYIIEDLCVSTFKKEKK